MLTLLCYVQLSFGRRFYGKICNCSSITVLSNSLCSTVIPCDASSSAYTIFEILVAAQAIFSLSCELIFETPVMLPEVGASWRTGKTSSAQPASHSFSGVTLTADGSGGR